MKKYMSWGNLIISLNEFDTITFNSLEEKITINYRSGLKTEIRGDVKVFESMKRVIYEEVSGKINNMEIEE